MRATCFLDAGVLIYAVSSAPSEAPRKRQALALLQRTDFGLSADGLQEFYVTVTSRIRRPLRPEVAAALIEEYRLFPVVPTDDVLILAAAELSLRHGLPYRDAAALAAARALDAGVVYSDRLPANLSFGGVRIVNPFEDPQPPHA